MKNRDLDKIYQEGLKDQEVTPPEGLWEKIADRLPQEPSNRRALPFWFPLVGTAAVLLLLFNIYILTHNSAETANEVTHESHPEIQEGEESQDHPITTQEFNQTIQSIVADFENRLQEANKNIDSLKQVTKKYNVLVSEENDTRIAEAPVSETHSTAGDSLRGEPRESTRTFNPQNHLPSIVQSVPTQPAGAEDAPSSPAVERDSMQDASLLIQEPRLEEQVAFDDLSDTEQAQKRNRFSVSTRIAPIFFETGGGNIFDQQFSQKKATSEVSFAYGINIAYNISDRVRLRSGLNKVEVGYQTQEVPYNSAVQSPALEASEKASTMSSPAPGELNQQLGFFEIPLEMEYVLVDKKFEISLVGGASSLFLDKNNVSLHSSVFTADLGEANNLNKTSFTTNLGLGINYNLTKELKFNLEPMFKYQLNTFKNTGVNPYLFGLYTGFSIHF